MFVVITFKNKKGLVSSMYDNIYVVVYEKKSLDLFLKDDTQISISFNTIESITIH